MDDLTKHYLIAALWTSTLEDGTPVDDDHDLNDLDPEAIERAAADCCKFREANASDLAETEATDEQSGHDFWLTRNGHGAGFWDRGYPKELGDRLSEASQAFGEIILELGDDGKLHFL